MHRTLRTIAINRGLRPTASKAKVPAARAAKISYNADVAFEPVTRNVGTKPLGE
jgi:hypothetical protein